MLHQLHSNAAAIVQRILRSDHTDIVHHKVADATVLDFAVGRPGSISAGLQLAEVCMAGMADVALTPGNQYQLPLPLVVVRTDHPLIACVGSQYAGWPISTDNYFAMCSGPARSLRGKEAILIEHELISKPNESTIAVGVFESNQLPDKTVVEQFATDCGVGTNQVTICVARTASLPGSIQVVARSVETALHKLHEIGFDLNTIRSGFGSAPLPPIASDDLTSLGWTNDAVLYGGQVHLWVETEDAAIEQVLPELPSSSSSDFGEPFLNIFNRYDRDFYKIDKLLFSPAHVVINNLTTGKTFVAGQCRNDILQTSFGMCR